MHTNNQFSLKRFMMLFKQSRIINKKLIGISLAGVTGTMFFTLLLFQWMGHFRNWDQGDYMISFILFFFSFGIIYSSQSFPAFRSKEKSIAYLMFPTSTSEKYSFELLTRVVAFILFMPLLFWIVANLEAAFVHHYLQKLTISKFSYSQGWTKLINNMQNEGWSKLALIQGGLFALIAAFTGGSHFSKSPLVKTLFTFSIIVGGYALYSYLLFKGLNIKEHSHSIDKILFFINEDNVTAFLAIAVMVINLSLLVIAWFRLKEKEA